MHADKFSYHPVTMKAMKSLGYRNPAIVQSMYIFKQPSVGGKVVPHQDSSFIYTEPMSCIGTWTALEDATKENGCLWVVPGSHKRGLTKRFKLNSKGNAEFDNNGDYDCAGAIPLEVPKGTLVMLHGCTVHYSDHNYSDKSRHAFTLHIIENEGCRYPSDNWLQRPTMPFRNGCEECKKAHGPNALGENST
jgi:phytanoyl-CoA hydroxylase